MNAIDVKDLWVCYRLTKSISLKKILRRSKEKPRTFCAVRGVSFTIPQGEIVGIVGKNGSGKSTLLRTIAGIFSADKGTIETYNHSISLLSIGVGFQNNLSGRENIMLSGMLMGFEEKYIRSKMDEIIDFSELEEFIEQPVRTYSSGMHSKLAFSITATLKANIILIDEVLSVGDSKFKKKSYKKMKKLIEEPDRTVLIVSHNSETIRKLCNKVIWLHKGELKMYGETKAVMDKYNEFMK